MLVVSPGERVQVRQVSPHNSSRVRLTPHVVDTFHSCIVSKYLFGETILDPPQISTIIVLPSTFKKYFIMFNHWFD